MSDPKKYEISDGELSAFDKYLDFAEKKAKRAKENLGFNADEVKNVFYVGFFAGRFVGFCVGVVLGAIATKS
jgi:hypothetical protein